MLSLTTGLMVTYITVGTIKVVDRTVTGQDDGVVIHSKTDRQSRISVLERKRYKHAQTKHHNNSHGLMMQIKQG